MYKILVCDDEKDIVSALKIYLGAENYDVLQASNGREAIKIAKEEELQLILLDIMMPVMDGISALNEIRKFSNVPVIFLTAKSEEIDMILGLNVGADDYITKPFRPVELLARVKAQIRRYMMFGGGAADETEKQVLRIGGIEMNDSSKRVTVEGEEVNLTPTEYAMLKLFMENPGRVFSPAVIYQTVWNESYTGSDRTVPVHIRHLREKIEINAASPRYLKVVWGQGYKFDGGGR
ncbi:MAG: response regulator transcription factor [Lachnospiraceae bacterium]|nr:response regulator transcription factor [Lachnospiraceae bacterium]